MRPGLLPLSLALAACRWDFALAPTGSGPDHLGVAPDAAESGDGAPDAAVPSPDGPVGDPAGRWLADSAVLATGSVRQRGDLTGGVRYELVLDGAGGGELRWMLLQGGQLDTNLRSMLLATTSLDEWVLTRDGTSAVEVMAVTWIDGDNVTLSYRVGDPRNLGTPTFTELRLRRAPARDQRLVGAFTYKRFRYPGGPEVDAGACEPGGATSRRVTGTLIGGRDLVLQARTTYLDFASPDCSGTGGGSFDQTTAWVEVTGATVDSWLANTGGELTAATWTLTDLGGGAVRLSRTGCRPGPTASCDDLFDLLELGP